MPGKEDPLNTGFRNETHTLWLERDGMLEARENYFKRYLEAIPRQERLDASQERFMWNTAWAATVAAFEYLMAGRIKP